MKDGGITGVTLRCPTCNIPIMISNPKEGEIINCTCGSQLRLEKDKASPEWTQVAMFLLGFIVGSFPTWIAAWKKAIKR